MQRILVAPRRNLDLRIQEAQFDFASCKGQVYWDESAYYSFTLRQIEHDFEGASAELEALCLDFVDRTVRDEQVLLCLGIPSVMWDLIAESWRRSDPSLYGRFDLAYDGVNPAKLLEYNADTPSALFEASVFQWIWLEDAIAQGLLPNSSDQFNFIHDELTAAFSALKDRFSLDTIHLTCMMDNREDPYLIAYLADVANQSGFSVTQLALADIGTTGEGPFLDLKNEPIPLLFKLYPWEWMWEDDFIRSRSMRITRFLEPPWKAILSSKAVLPLLWAKEPKHPNLLPSYFEDDPARANLSGRYVRKPQFSREGCNVAIFDDTRIVDSTDGPYKRGPHILQALATIPGHVPSSGVAQR
jgi:glutathionylspermidine synthase